MRLFVFIITALFVLEPALAQEPESPPRALSGAHLSGAFLSGLVGEVALGTLGIYLGFLSAGHCEESPDDDTFLGECFLHGVGEATVGSLVGINVGAPAGVYAYGALTGHEGSYGWATAGAALGTLAGIGLTTAMDNEAGLVLMGLMVPAGAVLGYQLGAPSADGTPPATALLDVSPQLGLRVGVPEVRWTRKDDDSRWFVSVMSGRF